MGISPELLSYIQVGVDEYLYYSYARLYYPKLSQLEAAYQKLNYTGENLVKYLSIRCYMNQNFKNVQSKIETVVNIFRCQDFLLYCTSGMTHGKCCDVFFDPNPIFTPKGVCFTSKYNGYAEYEKAITIVANSSKDLSAGKFLTLFVDSAIVPT